MQIVIHQTHHTIGDFKGVFQYLKAAYERYQGKSEQQLHLFPELFLTGYPLQDLCFEARFIKSYLDHCRDFNEWSQKLPANSKQLFLMGALDYEFDAHKDGQAPQKIYNAMYAWSPGEKLKRVYVKQLLPNYDIYDEKKYYSPGTETVIHDFAGVKLGLLICEDMWSSNQFDQDPVVELKKASAKNPLDLVVNLSASPFHLGKQHSRRQKIQEISEYLGAPMLYVNRVGGEDEILFDGASLGMDQAKVLFELPTFKAHEQSFEWQPKKNSATQAAKLTGQNTWEDLFRPHLYTKSSPASLIPLTDEDCEQAIAGMVFALQEYAHKCRLQRFLVAVSGGLDSALVLAIAKRALKPGQSIEAVYMPSRHSSTLSYELSRELCATLQVPLKSLPIKFFHSSIQMAFLENFHQSMEGLADENIQSRLRGALLYARSNQTGAMVINTSNKSEIAVGYSTQYGDSVGALSLLGDLYKTEVYQIARYMNRQKVVIPVGIIDRAPSAELRPDQRDDQSLPPYPELDAILEGFLSFRLDMTQIEELGFAPELIQKVYQLYRNSEYKRRQFAPIVKLKAKSFGFGYRIPICKAPY